MKSRFKTFGLALLVATLSGFIMPPPAHAWRSELYPEDWVPPHELDPPPSFETDKILQDFSYAGYRRGNTPIPDISGPIYNVASDYGADPSGSNNSTAAIQSAIDDAVAAGGGVVYLPEGTYRVRPAGSNRYSLNVHGDGVILRGEGPDKTFIFNDSWDMRGKRIIQIAADGGSLSRPPDGSPETLIREDLLGPTRTIPVEDVSGFSVGDWVAVQADTTQAWKEEHNVGSLWGDRDLRDGLLYVRQIEMVDEDTRTITIDVPTRYYLKTRDNARVHVLGPFFEEIGLEEFSIANQEHPEGNASQGWDTRDWNTEGTHAYEVHGALAILMQRVRNSWVRNVHSYRPDSNTFDAHVLSNGLTLSRTVAVTVENSSFQRAFYAGGGGNGYMLRMNNAQESLILSCEVGHNRHGFAFSFLATSGNVIHGGLAERTGRRAIAGGAGGQGSDHHMWFSQSNLIDGVTVDSEFFAAFYRGATGSDHGITATHSVFWNIEGLSYFGSRRHIINTQQSRWGYAIGTRGPANGVSTDGVYTNDAFRLEPVDHVEGVGMGDTLEPASIYLDQLQRRLSEQPQVVADPLIMPDGGTFSEPVAVSLSSPTAGASLHYTLDGSEPTLESVEYDGPFDVVESTTLKVRGFLSDFQPSPVRQAEFVILDEACFEVAEQWQSTSITPHDEPFEIGFEATPGQAPINAVMGLSVGAASSYEALVSNVRFNPDGQIDVRNGDAYEADVDMNYVAGQTYEFVFEVDPVARSYTVVVDGEVGLAESYAFRTDSEEPLNTFSSFAQSGDASICGLSVHAQGEEPDATLDPDEPQTDSGDADESEMSGDESIMAEGELGCGGCNTRITAPTGVALAVFLLGLALARRRG